MGTVPVTILDTVCSFFKHLLEKMMTEERAMYLEANQSTKANGFYSRQINSLFGLLANIRIPRTRDSNFRSALLPHGKTESNLEGIISELYTAGISSRSIESLLRKKFGVVLSHSSVSRLARVASEEILAWKQRPLKNYSVLYIDAFYFPLKRDTVQKEAVHVVLGIDENGYREVIGFWVPGGSEGASNWEEILREMKDRGVQDVSLIVADGLRGISEAISRVYPKAKYQQCVLHACRSSLNKVRSPHKAEVGNDLKMIYLANSKEDAIRSLENFQSKWSALYPKIILFWESNFQNLTNFMDFPSALRRLVYTTNWVERLHKEIKRRIKSMEQFQNELSCERILYALYQEQNTRYRHTAVNHWKELYEQYRRGY